MSRARSIKPKTVGQGVLNDAMDSCVLFAYCKICTEAHGLGAKQALLESNFFDVDWVKPSLSPYTVITYLYLVFQLLGSALILCLHEWLSGRPTQKGSLREQGNWVALLGRWLEG